ncbi:MAG: hypothetical protein ABI175_05430 [Polyangiales bacterium]
MPRFLRPAVLVGSVLTLIATSASAAGRDEAPPAERYEVTSTLDATEPEAPSTEPRRFYGWQNIAAGYAGIGMMAASIKTGGALPYVGFGVYALGGPIVHLAHEEYARAAGSLVINVLTPLLVGALAHSMDRPCVEGHDSETRADGCNIDTMSAAITGVVVGMLAAPLIDGLTMGWKDAPRKPAPTVSLQPTIAIARKEANGASTTMIGLTGAF